MTNDNEQFQSNSIEKYQEPGAPPIPVKGSYSSPQELHQSVQEWVKKRLEWEKINASTNARKEAYIKNYPEYKDHQFWDEEGFPSPDPKELATFVPAPEIDEMLNAPDERATSKHDLLTAVSVLGKIIWDIDEIVTLSYYPTEITASSFKSSRPTRENREAIRALCSKITFNVNILRRVLIGLADRDLDKLTALQHKKICEELELVRDPNPILKDFTTRINIMRRNKLDVQDQVAIKDLVTGEYKNACSVIRKVISDYNKIYDPDITPKPPLLK